MAKQNLPQLVYLMVDFLHNVTCGMMMYVQTQRTDKGRFMQLGAPADDEFNDTFFDDVMHVFFTIFEIDIQIL